MIDNKLITISKDNKFDKGWTLFHPFNLEENYNRSYQDVFLTDIVKLITNSNEVCLILSSPCLSSRIISEIEWANKYIKLDLIAKDDSIVKRYKSFSFDSVTIDSNIDFNYIGIIGKINKHFIISDGYVEIGENIYNSFFKKESSKLDFSFLSNAERIYIIDKDGKKDYSDFITFLKKEKIDFYYIINTTYFNKEIFDFAKNNKVDLLVSDYTENGVIAANKDFSLSCISYIKKDLNIVFPIEKITTYLGKTFNCSFYEEDISLAKIKGDIYSCYNGKISKLDLSNEKVIEIDVNIPNMEDFINEKFDSSIINSHNDFSAETKKVIYKFTLIPPLFDSSYIESSIYDNLHELNKSWNNIQKLNVDKVMNEYSSLFSEDYGLLKFLIFSSDFTKDFNSIVKRINYKNYYQWVGSALEVYKNFDKNILEICKSMFNSINEKSSESKFDKFDNEIEGYQQTIKEKTILINRGVDVLSNKRRVEILNKKINDLLELKKHFENSSSSRNDKSLNAFIVHCEELLGGHKKTNYDDSIGNIVKPREETKLAKLESFVEKYLALLKKYVVDCLFILESLNKELVPEDYSVYDKNGKRYIIIDNLAEFKMTANLCKDFDLECITRR